MSQESSKDQTAKYAAAQAARYAGGVAMAPCDQAVAADPRFGASISGAMMDVQEHLNRMTAAHADSLYGSQIWRNLERRRGMLVVARPAIKRDPGTFMRAMGNVIVLTASIEPYLSSSGDDVIRYHCLSPMFEEVEPGKIAPEYILEVSNCGGFRFVDRIVHETKERMLKKQDGEQCESAG